MLVTPMFAFVQLNVMKIGLPSMYYTPIFINAVPAHSIHIYQFFEFKVKVYNV